MKNRIFKVIAYMVTYLLLFQTVTYANSSWHWVTVSPLTVFPLAIILTLCIETIGIIKLNSIHKKLTSFVVVSISNFLSFMAPCFLRAYNLIPLSGGFSIVSAFNKGPNYIIVLEYLIITLIIEIPVVFLLLKKEVQNRKKLIFTILLTNIVTTLLIYLLERSLCRGFFI